MFNEIEKSTNGDLHPKPKLNILKMINIFFFEQIVWET